MKSKRIVAMFVALLTFMAVATSGLAAVTTKTNYQLSNDYVNVVVDVTGATSSSEVTYLVKNASDGIVYIDQATADDDGEVNFTYKIAKSKLPGLETSVSMGTNGTKKISGDTKIILGPVSLTVDEGADVAFYAKEADIAADIEIEDIANYTIGSEESVFAVITPLAGYEIDTAEGTNEAVEPTGMTIELKADDVVTVTTKSTSTDPNVYDFGTIVGDQSFTDEYGTIVEREEGTYSDVGGNYVAVTKILKATGTYKQVGVRYEDDSMRFAALDLDGSIATNFTDASLYAVRVVFEGETVQELVPYSLKMDE